MAGLARKGRFFGMEGVKWGIKIDGVHRLYGFKGLFLVTATAHLGAGRLIGTLSVCMASDALVVVERLDLLP